VKFQEMAEPYEGDEYFRGFDDPVLEIMQHINTNDAGGEFGGQKRTDISLS